MISWMIPFQEDLKVNTPERVKIALRALGNELLLSNNDSTSLVLPVKQLNQMRYQLSFEKELTFLPDSLVSIIDRNFEKSDISKNYIVEVIRCEDQEVSYSYEMNTDWDKTIVSCSGRQVPEGCHRIEITFQEEQVQLSIIKIITGVILLGLIVFMGFRFRESKKSKLITSSIDNHYTALGTYRFYPEQNKLVKESKELPLSRKECELLSIFVSRPNEVIKREELTKSVWEDNGVIVGRSLDTYISKLRKKLKGDPSIKITNLHGVGYRLEVG